jgi:hypothetical protein
VGELTFIGLGSQQSHTPDEPKFIRGIFLAKPQMIRVSTDTRIVLKYLVQINR